jgi:hypothetical protein
MEKRTTQHYSALFFSLLFLAVHFIPDAGSLEVNGPQWLYLGLLGIVSHVYIFFRREQYSAGISDLLSNYAYILFSAFVLWAGVSVSYAINLPEALIVLAKFIICTDRYIGAVHTLASVRYARIVYRFICRIDLYSCLLSPFRQSPDFFKIWVN